MLIAAEKITKQYNETPLLRKCSFYLSEGDKIGVIGRNGTGKSTLLKIMARQELPDNGTVTIHGGIRTGYLPQTPMLKDTATVLEQVMGDAVASGADSREYEAKHILHKLGIHVFDTQVGQLSGGQKKRVALAGVLIAPCEALILDEPTNHLDNDMIAWLESYLIQYTGAILMVTHDRYFLDRIVNKIAEVDRGGLYIYEANYTKYLELKALREEMEAGSERKRQSILRKELEWIQRGARARGTKSKSRIDRYEELRERQEQTAVTKLNLSSMASRLGKKTVEINRLSKSFGETTLIRDFDFQVARDARIGVVGPNGCGKSTLLGVISGRIPPSSGTVELGETVQLGYFTQESTDMDPTLRVIDFMKNFGDSIETSNGTLSATQLLEQFLFPSDLQWNTISRLSGGERRRLYLCSILIAAPNILLLDEPTNDLDIETLRILEDYIDGFPGAVIVVSHDRYFLDKVTDHILEFQEDGTLRMYLGGYSDYLNGRIDKRSNPHTPKNNQPHMSKRENSPPPKVRFSFQEQREYAVIDDEIAVLEHQLENTRQELVTASSDYERLEQLLAHQAELEQSLSEKNQRWFYLQEIAEAIEAQSGDRTVEIG